MVDLLHVGPLDAIPGLIVPAASTGTDHDDGNYVKTISKALLQYAAQQEYGKGLPAEGVDH